MTFLFPWLLGGLAALAIPVIIHLINRNRFRLIDWGAMRFLQQALVKSSRRVRLMQFLLLAVRLALLAALVLALARPRVRAGAFLTDESQGTVYFLLDLSASAGARGAGPSAGEPLERLRRRTDEILAGVPLGETIRLFALGDRGLLPLHEGLIYDREQARAVLKRAGARPVRADVALGLGEAFDRLERENAPRPWRLVTVTDFQAVSFAGRPPAPPKDCELIFLDCGPAQAESAGLADIRFARPLLAAGQTAKVYLTVRNGGSAQRTVPVSLLLNGEKKGTVSADLEPGEEREVEFVLRLPAAGRHLLTAELPADELPADDVRHHVFSVPERLPVAVVDGSPSREPMAGELDFFLAAMGARDDGGPFLVTRLAPGRVTEAALAGARLILVGDVARLGETEIAAIKRQVEEEGAGLLVALGRRSDQAAWNASGLLPAGLNGREAEELAVAAASLGSGPFHALDQTVRRQLGQVRLNACWALEPAPQAEVLAAAGERPWIVAAGRGRGRVVVFATDLDADDSDLIARGECFVPLAMNLAVHLAGLDAGHWNLAAGEAISRPAPDGEASLTVMDPAGVTRRLEPVRDESGRWHFLFADTRAIGVYRLGDEQYAVRLDPAESDLAPLAAADRDRLLEELGARLLTPDGRVDMLATEGGLFRAGLYLLLLLLVLESFLTGRAARREEA